LKFKRGSSTQQQQQQQQPSKPNMFPAAFVMKTNTKKWRLCLVKQVPSDSSSKWMLFGEHKINPNQMFQTEFKPYQETQLINHMVDLAMTERRNTKSSYAEICMELITDPPAVSCITTLWSLKGTEMYRRNRIRTSNDLYIHLRHDISLLSLTPQISQPSEQQQVASSPPQQSSQSHQSRHLMQTRSRQMK